MKLHSNPNQHVYWGKDGGGWAHQESELLLVNEEYIEWFKNSDVCIGNGYLAMMKDLAREITGDDYAC